MAVNGYKVRLTATCTINVWEDSDDLEWLNLSMGPDLTPHKAKQVAAGHLIERLQNDPNYGSITLTEIQRPE